MSEERTLKVLSAFWEKHILRIHFNLVERPETEYSLVSTLKRKEDRPEPQYNSNQSVNRSGRVECTDKLPSSFRVVTVLIALLYHLDCYHREFAMDWMGARQRRSNKKIL